MEKNDCIESAKPRDKRLCIGEFCKKSEFSTVRPTKGKESTLQKKFNFKLKFLNFSYIFIFKFYT